MEGLKLSLLLFLILGWDYLAMALLGLNLLFTVFGKKIMASSLVDFVNDYNQVAEPFKVKLFNELNTMKPSRGDKLKILEIGGGTGANFKYITQPAEVEVIEPNPHCAPLFEEMRQKFNSPNLVISPMKQGFGEDLRSAGIEDASVDVVIVTLVFCTVEDINKCAKEIQRVLKSGGKLLYLEHVAAEAGNWLRPLQSLLTQLGIYSCCFDGCCLDRDTPKRLQEVGGWTRHEQTKFDLPKPTDTSFLFKIDRELIKPHVMGVIEK